MAHGTLAGCWRVRVWCAALQGPACVRLSIQLQPACSWPCRVSQPNRGDKWRASSPRRAQKRLVGKFVPAQWGAKCQIFTFFFKEVIAIPESMNLGEPAGSVSQSTPTAGWNGPKMAVVPPQHPCCAHATCAPAWVPVRKVAHRAVIAELGAAAKAISLIAPESSPLRGARITS